MFKKNVAVTGFTVGLISSTDGSDITTGTPVGYYTLDGGAQTAIADVTPVHEGNGQWSFDLTAGEMNGDIVGLVFTHASAITQHFTIKTVAKLTADLNDFDYTANDVTLAAATHTGAVIPTVSTVTNAVVLPTIPANWITAAGINAAALNGKGDWNIGKTGYTLTQAFPANFASQVISGAGAVDSLIQGILNTALTETTAGRIAGNFDTFFENSDAATTKVVDDVGGAGGGSSDWTTTERNEIRGRLGITGTTAAGGNTPTLATSAEATAPVTLAAATHTGAVIPTVTTVSNAVTLPAIPANWITAAGVNAAALNGKGDWNIGKTGYSISGAITTLDGLENLSFSDVWTGVITESYAANSTAITPAQAFYMIWSDLRSPDQAGTVWTDYKVDNTTAAMAFSLDNATTPTKKVRTS